jgi:hypothetical protein
MVYYAIVTPDLERLSVEAVRGAHYGTVSAEVGERPRTLKETVEEACRRSKNHCNETNFQCGANRFMRLDFELRLLARNGAGGAKKRAEPAPSRIECRTTALKQ